MDYYDPRRRALRAVRQLLYPRECPFCGRVLGDVRDCPDCAKQLDALRRKPGIRLDPAQHYISNLAGAAAPYRYSGCVRRGILNAKYQGKPWRAVEMGNRLVQLAFSGELTVQYGELLPQPEPRPADATSGDTTCTSIIKAFLGRMVPGADSKFLDAGKKDFTNFFGTSVAVVPDDMKSEQERQQTPKKKGLFGFGYATDTGEFEPINVSVSGRVENQSTQQLEEQLPRLQDVLQQDEPDEMELREQEPPRHHAAKKKGFFTSLFGGKKHDVYDELESYDPYEGEPDTAPVENWEVPEQPREEPETEETGEMPRLTATNAGLSISGQARAAAAPYRLGS